MIETTAQVDCWDGEPHFGQYRIRPESFLTCCENLEGDQRAGQPGTTIVGVGASIQLYEESCLTSVIDADGGTLRSWRSRREISVAGVNVIFRKLVPAE